MFIKFLIEIIIGSLTLGIIPCIIICLIFKKYERQEIYEYGNQILWKISRFTRKPFKSGIILFVINMILESFGFSILYWTLNWIIMGLLAKAIYLPIFNKILSLIKKINNKDKIDNKIRKYSIDDIVKDEYELEEEKEAKIIINEKRKGNYEKALNLLDKFEKKSGVSVSTLNIRAKIYTCQQRFEEAIELYKISYKYCVKHFGEPDITSDQHLYILQNMYKMNDDEILKYLKEVSGNENYNIPIRKNK